MGIPRSGPLKEALRRMRSMLLSGPLLLMVIGVVVGYALIFVGELVGLKALGIRTNGSALAFILGFLIATFLCITLYTVIALTGAANYLTGALAESWSNRELSELGPEWHIFSNVPFLVGSGDKSYEVDVDHIVVGPYGVLVIETKYCSSPLDLGSVDLPKRITDAVNQVEDNAGRVRALLHQVAPVAPIRPVVIFWGRLVTPAETSVRRIEGRAEYVRVIRGGDGGVWRPRLKERALLSEESVGNISAKIETYLAKYV